MSENHSPLIEYSIGREMGNKRSAYRYIYNKKTGDLWLTTDHYQSAIYVGCKPKQKKLYAN